MIFEDKLLIIKIQSKFFPEECIRFIYDKSYLLKCLKDTFLLEHIYEHIRLLSNVNANYINIKSTKYQHLLSTLKYCYDNLKDIKPELVKNYNSIKSQLILIYLQQNL